MDEEMIVLQIEEEDDNTIEIEESAPDVEPDEVVEYIDVEEPAEVVIEMDEGFSPSSGTNGIFASVNHGHQIFEISGLEDELDGLTKAHDYYSVNGGFAEFRKWQDGNENKEPRTGYFVSLSDDGSGECINICQTQTEDVYGVTVRESGFCGYQDKKYNPRKKENSSVVEGEENYSIDLANDAAYEKVCLLGTVEVRVFDVANFNKINIGDFVIPDANGCAKKSDNNIGFKVIMRHPAGVGANAWNAVTIALVPQNDNVARVMEELKKTNEGLGNINQQLGDLNTKVDNNISISKDFEDLSGKFDTLQGDVGAKFDTIDETLDEAKQISGEAKQAITDMGTSYADALQKVDTTIQETNSALNEIDHYRESLEILAEHDGHIAGFFKDATDDSVTIGTLVSGYNEANSNLSVIEQTEDAIKHLVCSVDIYSVGDKSPTYGLTAEQAIGALGAAEYIYVPIRDYTEVSPIYIGKLPIQAATDYYFTIGANTYHFVSSLGYEDAKLEYNAKKQQLTIDGNIVTVKVVSNSGSVSQLTLTNTWTTVFKEGKSYKWVYNSSDGAGQWREDISVSFAANPPSDDTTLWYSRNGVEGKYNPGTLYRLTNYIWVAVATLNDPNTRIMSVVNQTADLLTSTITNVEGDMSRIEQTVDEISTTVAGHEGQLSEVIQNAEHIVAGTYNGTGDAAQLAITLNRISSTVSKTSNELAATLQGTPPRINAETHKYTQPPVWDAANKQYVFSGDPDPNGTYCINPTNPTQYYKLYDDSYEIYVMGAQAIASLQQQVNTNTAKLEDFTGVDSATNETLTSIFQESDLDSAEIGAVVMGEYRERTEINLDPIKDTTTLGDRYTKRPDWDGKEFVFDSNLKKSDGAYCYPPDDDKTCYWKLLIDIDTNIIGYEKYEMRQSNYAAITEKVDSTGAVIGLKAGTKDADGGIFVKVINNQSSALISADKIGINGTAVFSDRLAEGKTTISGDYLRTGVITSNNYSGPVTYRMHGAKLDTDNLVIATSDTLTDCIYYAPADEGTLSINSGYYYAKDIKTGQQLFSSKQEDSVYIVSDKDFDLIPSNIETQGTKFDLNVGTIYSKNFSLDRGGNLDISGRISATSGYIGDSTNGFTIDTTAHIRTYTVSSEGLTTGKYYFKHNDHYYPFTVDSDLGNGIDIKLNINASTIQIGSNSAAVISATDEEPGDAIYLNSILSFQSTDYYYLSNGQSSLTGSNDRVSSGVYMSPEGIGLGHGRFYVDKDGNVTMAGDITFTGDGEIKWENSFTKILYARTKLTTPTGKYTDYDPSDTNNWHRTYSSSDYYASYNYNGGVAGSWNAPVRIESEDATTYDYLTKDGITSTTITSATIISPTITGGTFKVTGKGSASGSAYYIYSGNTQQGYLSFDNNGSSPDASDRVFLTTSSGVALKLQATQAGLSMEGSHMFIRGIGGKINGKPLDSYITLAADEVTIRGRNTEYADTISLQATKIKMAGQLVNAYSKEYATQEWAYSKFLIQGTGGGSSGGEGGGGGTGGGDGGGGSTGGDTGGGNTGGGTITGGTVGVTQNDLAALKAELARVLELTKVDQRIAYAGLWGGLQLKPDGSLQQEGQDGSNQMWADAYYLRDNGSGYTWKEYTGRRYLIDKGIFGGNTSSITHSDGTKEYVDAPVQPLGHFRNRLGSDHGVIMSWWSDNAEFAYLDYAQGLNRFVVWGPPSIPGDFPIKLGYIEITPP